MKKTMKTKFMVAGLALSLTTGMLGGVSVSADDRVELDIWLQVTDTTDTEEKYAAFAEAHPEIKLNFVAGGDASSYMQKLLMAADNGNLPDVFDATCANVVGIPESGALLDISGYIDDEWMSRIASNGLTLQQEMYGEDTIYGVPDLNEIQGWFLNKAMFEAQGLEIPTTWDEWVNCMQVFIDAGITPIAHGASNTWSRWGFDLFFDRYGFVENKEALVNKEMKFSEFCIPAFERIAEMAEMGAFPSNVSTATHTEALELFKAGVCPIITVGSWALSGLLESEYADDFVFSWGPEFTDSEYPQNYGTKTCSWTWWVNKDVEKDEAKLNAILAWFRYMADPTFLQYKVDHGDGLCAYNLDEVDMSNIRPLYSSMLEKSTDDYIGVGEISSYLDPSFETEYWNAVSAVITQTATPEEAAQMLDTAQANMP